ncbi:MAG: nicotinate (nicotinamide) nucleotide adenylyltransferase [Cyanobacteria bacterium SZAS LIN-3]|nr:nicotinate (nicotinamide) nucleotide adenylyltransferase [Cyanobacteria bacterium SZAS LIN-3]MBS2011255.1 nicotinate (nicotinamide) nucleotide adenylyltransferase [Cyanobacteria bacterium SZAS TMP-1]
MKELGIMGGAFNPIHSRHLLVAQCAIDQLGMSKVLFVPSGDPPHKKDGLLDKESRFEMVQLACSDNPLFEASRLEIDRPGITWTIDTLKALKQQHEPTVGQTDAEAVRLNFIIGEDNLPVLAKYDRAAEFLGLCRLVVSPRQTSDSDQALLKQWLPVFQAILPEAQLAILAAPANEVSSTTIRNWIEQGRSVRYLVHDKVYAKLVSAGHYQKSKTV